MCSVVDIQLWPLQARSLSSRNCHSTGNEHQSLKTKTENEMIFGRSILVKENRVIVIEIEYVGAGKVSKLEPEGSVKLR